MDISFASAVVVLLLVTDPIGNIPLFATLLQTVEPARREGAHVLAAEGHVARVRAVEAAEEVEQGALAASA